MNPETISNCDAVIWAIQEANTLMTFFRTENKVKPTELGYKYNIVMFREGDTTSLEAFSAIIGDPKGFVERNGKAGYNGLMLKQKSCTKKQMNKTFMKSLQHWGFTEKETRWALKQLG